MKKSTHRRRQRQRRAAARAARASQANHANRTSRPRRARSERSPSAAGGELCLLTGRFTPDGPVTSSISLPRSQGAAMRRYLQAHDLLPADYGVLGTIAEEHERAALATLGAPAAQAKALLKAIVVLGHSPTGAALHALERHAASGRRYADEAALAANECAEWMLPPAPAAAGEMLN